MTRKGVWDLQDVRDKYLQDEWVQTYQWWAWGENNNYGQLGFNDMVSRSSPAQIPGDDWRTASYNSSTNKSHNILTKNDGTLWGIGFNAKGEVGQNNTTNYSSPTQIGTETTWSLNVACGYNCSMGVKNDNTLWVWGWNEYGRLGTGESTNKDYSSPVQIGTDTTWSTSAGSMSGGQAANCLAVKTDGTMWGWGNNNYGQFGVNTSGTGSSRSSPTQLPGSTWSKVCNVQWSTYSIKTDGTLWSWGYNKSGQLGQNQGPGNPSGSISSPTQIGTGTDWESMASAQYSALAIKTDGTMWGMGRNWYGELGHNSRTYRSSPTQIAGTTWAAAVAGKNNYIATRTDGTLWSWGYNAGGSLGLGFTYSPSRKAYSSPTQIPGTGWATAIYQVGSSIDGFNAIQQALTPSQL